MNTPTWDNFSIRKRSESVPKRERKKNNKTQPVENVIALKLTRRSFESYKMCTGWKRATLCNRLSRRALPRLRHTPKGTIKTRALNHRVKLVVVNWNRVLSAEWNWGGNFVLVIDDDDVFWNSRANWDLIYSWDISSRRAHGVNLITLGMDRCTNSR